MFLLIGQSSFLSMAEVFQGTLAAHRAGAIRLGFEVGKLEGTARARVPSAAPGVVLAQAAHRVGGPPRIKRTVNALGDIDVGL